MDPTVLDCLPRYFIADLPSEAALSEQVIREACETLVRNRERFLLDRSTDQIVETLLEVAASWRRDDFPLRQLALQLGPEATGFSRPILQSGIDQFFQSIQAQSLGQLLLQELGHTRRLDEFATAEARGSSATVALARGPELLVHIAPGNIPVPALQSIVLGLLVRSAQVVKCASGRSLLARLFAHSIYQADPKLGACLEVAEWRGGRHDLERSLFSAASVITATGSDTTLQDIRSRLPEGARFVGHGHRVSFGYLTREALSRLETPAWIQAAADDIVAWDQLGCLSPHVIYVEDGATITGPEFAQRLAEELERRESVSPRGPVGIETAALIRSRRDFYQIRAAQSAQTQVWQSRESTSWTVVYEADPLFQTSCLHRFIYIKAVADLGTALHAADAVRRHVSTVGLAAPADRATPVGMALARWGVSRICPLGRMQQPPLTWRHDGRPALGDLLLWTDYERPH